MIDPTMQDGNAPFDGDTFWAGYEDTWAPFDEPPSSSSSTGGGGGGSKGSKGSKGGYKYPPPPADNCDCEIKESVVPAGGAEASEGPALLGSKTRTLKFKWTEAEPLDSVPPNLPRHFYSRVTANWSVKKCEENCEGGSQVSGSYDFIFKCLVQPSTGEKLKTDLNITLSPKHGSHQGADNKMPPWPIFDGMTPEQRKDQWAKNVYEIGRAHV